MVAYPSVGDQVLMPTPQQVEAIVGMSNTPTFAWAHHRWHRDVIAVDPDRLFGRHLVLGNTGSGAARCRTHPMVALRRDGAIKAAKRDGRPNARFIVLDPNGEYARAFADLKDKARVFRVPPVQVPSAYGKCQRGCEWSARPPLPRPNQRYSVLC